MPRWMIALVFSLACLAPGAIATVEVEGLGAVTREQLLDRLVTGDPTNAEIERLDDHLPEALAVFESAHRAEPKDGRWAAGVALVMLRQGEVDGAYDWAKKGVKLSPKSADAQYTLGTVAGRKTESASLFSKMGYADRCRKAFQKAVEIDPSHFPSRVGLVMYYTFAPGIAGGSWKKAYEQAEAITRIPGYADDGHALTALVASQKGDWERYDRAIEDALSVAESLAERDDIHADAAYIMAMVRDDPAGALAHLDVIEDEGVMSSTGYTFVRAVSLMKLDRQGEAIPWFEKTIERNPEAENSHYYLAVCAMQTGQHEKAIGAYEQYLERFPDGEHTREVKRGLRNAKERTDGR